MDKRAVQLAVAIFCAAATMASPVVAGQAQETQGTQATHAAPAAPPATTPAITPAISRRPVVAPPPRMPRSDPYRCQADDVACTVVRETTRGLVVVTLRPQGTTARPAVWSVVSGTPPGADEALGGTVYVVPTTRPEPRAELPPPGAANGAPILD
jgi:hypothetical protein